MREGLILGWLLMLPCLGAEAWPRKGLVLAPPAVGSALQLEPDEGCGTVTARPDDVWGGGLTLAGASVRRSARVDGTLARLIEEAAAAHGLDASLVTAIVRVESAFNPHAVSHKGAMGLMQIMPATARGLGISDPARDLLDPHTNLRAGARHLRGLHQRYPGRLDLAIAAYNAGEGAVARWAGIPPYPETRQYVESVLSWYEVYRAGGASAPPRVTGCS
ncbi:lytic transglycosylase domain-containing protein [Rhizobacter sp. LjRoot28]|uniref:lytic transglycosylase domain-containing protein n=1 Tax=Rhizobacter sp. LjRoot28 TaxID=3342309 RepID=UPI003ED0E8C8